MNVAWVLGRVEEARSALDAARTFSTRVKITLTQNTNNIFEILSGMHTHTLAHTHVREAEHTSAARRLCCRRRRRRDRFTTNIFTCTGLSVCVCAYVCVCNIFIITAQQQQQQQHILTFSQPTHLMLSHTHTH